MLHEIYPRRFDNGFRILPPEDGDYALYYAEGGVALTGEAEAPELPTLADLGGAAALEQHCFYLFCIDDARYFLLQHPPLSMEGCSMMSLTEMRTVLPQHQAFAATTGAQLYRWYRDNTYCGRCGKPTRRSETERAMCCDACHNVVYPKISPAIIVAISDGSRLVMTRGHSTTYRRYGLVAGFVEVGETFEEAVVREVKEEVGLNVKNVQYYKSQPWGVSDSEMIGFFAELDGDDTITVQEAELSEAVWFAREDIPPTLTSQSIAQELIEAARSGAHPAMRTARPARPTVRVLRPAQPAPRPTSRRRVRRSRMRPM